MRGEVQAVGLLHHCLVGGEVGEDGEARQVDLQDGTNPGLTVGSGGANSVSLLISSVSLLISSVSFMISSINIRVVQLAS